MQGEVFVGNCGWLPGASEVNFQRAASADIILLQSRAEHFRHIGFAQLPDPAPNANQFRAGPIGGVQLRQRVLGQRDDLLSSKGIGLAQSRSRGQTKRRQVGMKVGGQELI